MARSQASAGAASLFLQLCQALTQGTPEVSTCLHLNIQVQQDAWIDLVGKCDLFSDGPNCYATGVTGSACQRPAVGSQTWLTSGSQKWRPTQYLYGTGFVPNNGELWRNTLVGPWACTSVHA